MSKTALKLQPWLDARRRFKLSHAHIQMAYELGMNPKKFGSLATEKQQPWKAPLPEFIEHCYFKRFKRAEPTQVRSLEQMMEADESRRKMKKEQKAIEASFQPTNGEVQNVNHQPNGIHGCVG